MVHILSILHKFLGFQPEVLPYKGIVVNYFIPASKSESQRVGQCVTAKKYFLNIIEIK